MTAYAELHAISNFTFLKGASHPEELVATATKLGYAALAITDECSVSGAVRAHMSAREQELGKLIIGSEFLVDSDLKLVALAQNRDGYAALCRLITQGRRAADKGSYQLTAADFADGLPTCLLLWVPDRQLTLLPQDDWILDAFRERLWIAVELLADGLQRQRLERLQILGEALNLPLVASGDVHMHCRERRTIQDTLTAVREGVTLDRAGYALYPNGER
jgi:error-prone DNA polymerase